MSELKRALAVIRGNVDCTTAEAFNGAVDIIEGRWKLLPVATVAALAYRIAEHHHTIGQTARLAADDMEARAASFEAVAAEMREAAQQYRDVARGWLRGADRWMVRADDWAIKTDPAVAGDQPEEQPMLPGGWPRQKRRGGRMTR
jgi:hypothetical protein